MTAMYCLTKMGSIEYMMPVLRNLHNRQQFGIKMTMCTLTRMAQLIGVILQSEMTPVQFPVWAHAWVAGLVLVGVCARGNQQMFLSHTDVSLLLFLLPYPLL